MTGKKIIVTGGAGFLGKHIVSQLETQDNEVFVPRSAEHNLESKLTSCSTCRLAGRMAINAMKVEDFHSKPPCPALAPLRMKQVAI